MELRTNKEQKTGRHLSINKKSRIEIIKRKDKVFPTNIVSAGSQRQAIANWIKTEIDLSLRADDLRLIKTEDKVLFALRNKIRKAGILKFVDAKFEKLCSYEDALVKIPPADDSCLQLCQEHFCVIPNNPDLTNNPDIIFVPKHWRRSVEQVYRNFYMTTDEFLGQTVVADVVIQMKTDLSTGKQNIVLNYQNIRPKESCCAANIIKIGTPTGQIPIPETNKFICAKRLENATGKKSESDQKIVC